MGDRHDPAVLVVSDDAELGGLVALNLRRRGLLVEHALLGVALGPGWAPTLGPLDLLVVHLEAPEHLPAPALSRLVGRPWMRGVPFLLAAERAEALVRALPRPPDVIIARPTDVGGIVAAARACCGRVPR